MSSLLAFFFDRALGKAGLVALGLTALVGWWQLDRSHQRQLGEQNAKHEINEKAGELAEKAHSARDAVDDDAALDGLRQRFCRDC